jgi:putative spermidine/putrescine transport system ATP-binding protein
MNSDNTAITLSACAKTFGDGTRALEPVNLEVEGGETVVLLGPSGCGKTTLLRIIAGLEMPDPGGRTSPIGLSKNATSAWCSSPTRCFPI